MAQAGDIEALDCDPIVLALLDLVAEYENSITWDTTCLNCAQLLDKLYAAEMKLEQCNEKREAPPDETDW